MKHPILLSVLVIYSCTAFSQTKKTTAADTAKHTSNTKPSATPLAQEIIWPTSAKNKPTVVIKPRPVVVTHVKL